MGEPRCRQLSATIRHVGLCDTGPAHPILDCEMPVSPVRSLVRPGVTRDQTSRPEARARGPPHWSSRRRRRRRRRLDQLTPPTGPAAVDRRAYRVLLSKKREAFCSHKVTSTAAAVCRRPDGPLPGSAIWRRRLKVTIRWTSCWRSAGLSVSNNLTS